MATSLTLDNANVFVVEDDEAWAATLEGKLNKKFKVSTFASGEAALDQLNAKKPALIILDYHLEGQLTGLDTLKKIKQQQPDTLVIMFSAQDDVQTALDILNNGAFDYIVKGENAVNRLRIILRNLEERDMLQRQLVEIRIRMRRERFYLGLVVLLIVIGSMIIYLDTCPTERSIKWDPFDRLNSKACNYLGTEKPDIPFKGDN